MIRDSVYRRKVSDEGGYKRMRAIAGVGMRRLLGIGSLALAVCLGAAVTPAVVT